MSSLDATLGAYEIGVLVSYVLFGVATLQTYVYFCRFPCDVFRLKFMVAFIWFGELGHSVCLGHSLYQMTVSDYGHPDRLVLIPRSLAVGALFSGIVGTTVQVFFTFRIYNFSKSLYIPCLSWTLSFLCLLGSILVCVYGFRLNTIPAFEARWSWLFNTVWSMAAADDVLIAVTLVYWLIRNRPAADSRTLAPVNKLIKWTLETGVITSVAAVTNLVCYRVMQENFIWLGFFVALAKLYSNSLLASLNSRATLRTIADRESARIEMSFARTGISSEYPDREVVSSKPGGVEVV